MNNNISVSFIDTKQAVDNKPPTQSVGVSGACHFTAGGNDKRYFAISSNPRFQLFVAEYLAEKNISPYSLKVEENAFLFLQDNDPNLLWVAFCDWFADKQKQGRWINDSTPDKSTPFEFGQQGDKPVHQAATIGQSPVTQTAPQATNQAATQKDEAFFNPYPLSQKEEIDKPAVIVKVLDLFQQNLNLLSELIGVLK